MANPQIMNYDTSPEVVPMAKHSQLAPSPGHLSYVSRGDELAQPNDHNAKRICGMRQSTFWLLFALLVVTIAAAVGGGVGGSLAVKHAKSSNQAVGPTRTSEPAPASSTTTSAPASSTYTPPAATQVAHLPGLCDDQSRDLKNLPSTANSTAVFKPYCGQDSAGADIIKLVMYSYADCVNACVSYNSGFRSDVCVAAQFNPWMGKSVSSYGANCFLKDKANSGSPYDGTIVFRLCRDLNCNSVYT